jgi:hypothetical protein
MKRQLFIVCFLFYVCPCLAQLPSDYVAAGVAWNQYSAPQIAGTLLYAHQLQAGLFSFNLVDVTSKTVKPFTVQTAISTGLAQHVRDIGPGRLFVTTTAGLAAGGENVGWAWSAGGAVAIPINKHGWTLLGSARVLKASIGDFQAIYGLAIGWGK